MHLFKIGYAAALAAVMGAGLASDMLSEIARLLPADERRKLNQATVKAASSLEQLIRGGGEITVTLLPED